MKKLPLIILCLVTLAWSLPALAVNFEQETAAANYLDEYQSKQERAEWINRGIWLVFLLGGGIALGSAVKKKRKP